MVVARTLIAALCLFVLGQASFIYAQPPMSNLEIIKSTYEGNTSQENSKNLQQHMADKVRWTEAAGFPYAGTYVGFAAIRQQVFQRLATQWTDYKFSVENYVANGDKVVAYGTYSGTYQATQKYFEARVAHIWTLEDGKIIEFEQFVDSKMVADAISQ